MFDDSYDWSADTATATLPRVEHPVVRTMRFPLPPAMPEGANFWEFRVERDYARSAPDLDRAVSEYMRCGTASRLTVRAEKHVPCTAECGSFADDTHAEDTDCGSTVYECEYDSETQAWGEWQVEC